MRKIEANEIPALVAGGEISEGEAVRALWEDVYSRPGTYALAAFGEDDLSEFLLRFHTRFAALIRAYDGRTEFTTFVRSCIMLYKLTWRKAALKSRAEEASLLEAAKGGAVESVRLTESPALPLPEPRVRRRRKAGRRFPAPTLRLAKDTALVLALKSCRAMDDETLRRVSSFTGRSEEEILAMMERLGRSAARNEARRERIAAQRDEAFYRRRRYARELSALDPQSAEYGRLLRGLEAQSRSWIARNEALERRCVMSPQNEEIAAVLGMRPRKVFYCISHVQKDGVLESYREMFRSECPEEADD